MQKKEKLKKGLKVFSIIGLTIILSGCGAGGDYTEELSGGYYYRHEGGETNDILCNKAEGGEIPATVIGFDYNEDFIVAKQKPKIPQDPLYEKKYVYQNGTEELYYWIIAHKEEKILGPLDSISYEKARVEYDLPEDLIIKIVQ